MRERCSYLLAWSRKRCASICDGADECSRAALTGELVVVGEDVEARRIPVVFGSSKKAIETKLEIKAMAPDIVLRRLSELSAP